MSGHHILIGAKKYRYTQPLIGAKIAKWSCTKEVLTALIGA
jgi:hypothetical protein